MPSEAGSKRAAIRRIARNTGYSESTVYKVLTNPMGFSPSTVECVRQAADACGLRMNDPAARGRSNKRTLRISVILPARPLYFWREAVLGMERSRARLEEELGVVLHLQFRYYGYPFEETECERILSVTEREMPDALILFPVEQESFRRFLAQTDLAHAPRPVILFNDTQDYMTDAWFSDHPYIGYIGPDGYSEGTLAADLIGRCAPSISRVAVVYSRQDHGAMTSDDRIRGVCDSLIRVSPAVQICRVELDPTERIAPATLARRLVDCYEEGDVDCVYISSGVTHIASAAVEKIERRQGRPLSTFVIGHECSAADRRYLLEGRQRGYIKQDVYTQGAEAVRDAVFSVLGEIPPIRKLFPSSMFVR